MVTITNIQKLITAYLNGQSVDVFGANFADLFYDIEKTGDHAAIQLAYEIESMLTSVTAGLLSEDDFKNCMHGKIPSTNFTECVLLDSGVSSVTQWVAVAPAEFARAYIAPLGGFGLTIAPQQTHLSNIGQLQSPQVLVA